jgi:hypothetical protein
MKILLILSLVLITSACVKKQTTKYSDPSEGDLATIEFVTAGIGGPLIGIFQEYETCSKRAFSRMSPKSQSKTHRVTASSPLSFSYTYVLYADHRGSALCENFATFKPKSNAHYKIRSKNSLDKCSLDIYSVEDGSESKIDFIKRTKTTPWSDDGSWCETENLGEL